MPITQSRMISLINAATDYQQALERASTAVASQVQAVRDGRGNALQALDYLAIMLVPHGLLTDPGRSLATIEIERAHFKSHQRGNIRRAKAMARKRGQTYSSDAPPESIPVSMRPQSTAPRSAIAPQSIPKTDIDLAVEAELALLAEAEIASQSASQQPATPDDDLPLGSEDSPLDLGQDDPPD